MTKEGDIRTWASGGSQARRQEEDHEKNGSINNNHCFMFVWYCTFIT